MIAGPMALVGQLRECLPAWALEQPNEVPMIPRTFGVANLVIDERSNAAVSRGTSRCLP
jgi:hypothetical protein